MDKSLQLLSLDQLTEMFESLPSAEEDANLYDDIALQIRARGGNSYLIRAFSELDHPIQKASILFSLSARPEQFDELSLPPAKTSEVANMIKIALKVADETIVSEAIDSARTMDMRELVDHILGLYSHPSPFVKGSVLRYIAKVAPDSAFNMLISALVHPHFIVRENAVDELSELELTRQQKDIVLTQLRPMVNDNHPHVRQAVSTALLLLDDE